MTRLLYIIPWLLAAFVPTDSATRLDTASAAAGQPLFSPVPGEQACRFDPEKSLTTDLGELISEDDPFLGNPKAEVVVVEFFDPNCVHCQAFHPVMGDVLEAYGDRIRFYMKPFALWEYSFSQIKAMLIAARAGKYHEMIDQQLENPGRPSLSDETLVDMAGRIGLDEEAFSKVLASDDLTSRVQFLRLQARNAGVRSTPTVVINRRDQVVASEARTFECMSRFLDEELDAAE